MQPPRRPRPAERTGYERLHGSTSRRYSFPVSLAPQIVESRHTCVNSLFAQLLLDAQ
jgi:hypothetical protein